MPAFSTKFKKRFKKTDRALPDIQTRRIKECQAENAGPNKKKRPAEQAEEPLDAVKLHPELEVIALYEAFDKSDSLVSKCNKSLRELPAGSRIGTSSPLRRKELLSVRPDLQVVGIRGTIEDRIEQVRRGDIDAAIVATCALKRLGLEDEIAEVLPFSTHPMQGRLAVTARKGRNDLKAMFKKGSIL